MIFFRTKSVNKDVAQADMQVFYISCLLFKKKIKPNRLERDFAQCLTYIQSGRSWYFSPHILFFLVSFAQVSRSLIIELNSLTFCYRKECVSRLISFSKQALAKYPYIDVFYLFSAFLLVCSRHCVENSAPVFMSSKDRLSVFGTKVGHLFRFPLISRVSSPLFDYNLWFFRRGNMTVHITLKPLVLLLASSVSRLALSSGSVDFHFFPGKTSVPPLQCTFLCYPSFYRAPH
jgi:hypothetical protein